jgi:hypothetical protein
MTAWSEQITANGGWFPFYGPRSNTSGRAASGWAATDAGFRPADGIVRGVRLDVAQTASSRQRSTMPAMEGEADCRRTWQAQPFLTHFGHLA